MERQAAAKVRQQQGKSEGNGALARLGGEGVGRRFASLKERARDDGPSGSLNVEPPRRGSYCGSWSLADGLADPGTGNRRIGG